VIAQDPLIQPGMVDNLAYPIGSGTKFTTTFDTLQQQFDHTDSCGYTLFYTFEKSSFITVTKPSDGNNISVESN
jgi:hypothetical protein